MQRVRLQKQKRRKEGLEAGHIRNEASSPEAVHTKVRADAVYLTFGEE